MQALAHIVTPEFFVAFVITFFAATVQSTIGFGFALLSVPLLSLLNPVFAPVPQLVVFLPLAVAIVVREWSAVEPKSIAWILVGRIPGALIGVTLLKLLLQPALDVLMAAMVAVGVVLVVGKTAFRRSPWMDFAAGTASGTMAMVSAIGGPPIALLYRNASGSTVRANLGLVFTIGVCLTLTVRASAGEVSLEEVIVGVAFLPAVLMGLHASRGLLTRVEGRILRNAIVLVALLAAAMLCGRGVLNW